MEINFKTQCRIFAIIGTMHEENSVLAENISTWLASRGLNILYIERGGENSAKAQSPRKLEDVLPHLGVIHKEAMRGYFSQGPGLSGRLSINGRAPSRSELGVIASAYELVLVSINVLADVCAKKMDEGRLISAFADIPALVVVDAAADRGVLSAKRVVDFLLSAKEAPRPAAFAISPHDAAVTARLARSLRLPSWGDAADISRLSERILERAIEINCGENKFKNDETDRNHLSQLMAQDVLKKIQEHRDISEAINSTGLFYGNGKSQDMSVLKDRIAMEARRIVAGISSPQQDLVSHEYVVARVIDDALGFGPITSLLADPEVTEVMACGARKIYIERKGKIESTDLAFVDDAHLMAIIERMLLPTGRRIDEASPAVDARLPDGSRLHAIIPPLSIDGPALTIRRFVRHLTSLAEAVAANMLSQRAADFLAACVRGRVSMVVSGGTGAGKTTLLGTLASEIDPCERIITIEDSAELRIKLPHVVRLEARPPNIEGSGAVQIRELVRNALRMRPDRIVVGECRGAEALDMLQAMNTGHEGSLTTVHANSPRDAVSRLETMSLMAGLKLPLSAIREQVVRAIGIIIQVARMPDGSRRVSEIAEICETESQEFKMHTLARVSENGALESTGIVPRFAARLKKYGIELPTL